MKKGSNSDFLVLVVIVWVLAICACVSQKQVAKPRYVTQKQLNERMNGHVEASLLDEEKQDKRIDKLEKDINDIYEYLTKPEEKK